DDVEQLLLVGDLAQRQRDRRINIADHEVHAVAVDELAHLLHAGADIIGGILDQQLDGTADDAALGVDLLDRELGADDLVLRRRRIDAGQRIDHADLDRRLAARLDDERGGDLQYAGGGTRLQQRAALDQ